MIIGCKSTLFNAGIVTPATCNNAISAPPYYRYDNSYCSFRSSYYNTYSLNLKKKKKKKKRLQCACCSLVLPLLPFPLEQVLVPSETKTLHLYEARYLQLLEESVSRQKNFFVHFVLDPIVVGYATSGPSFAARYGCLSVIEKVERLDVGALVSVRGVGRVTIAKFEQSEPYLKGMVLPLQDNVPDDLSNISKKVLELKKALHSLNSLEIKLKAPKEAALQTQTANSLSWSEKEFLVDCEKYFLPSIAERVSFAALQPISGTSQSELLELQKEKLNAMDIKETLERLEMSLKLANNNISVVVAKLAIQSLNLQ
ncbi:hypothetical protein DCAR_0519880 [Daucus carota subsp. sativus]|uniref:Uncharacterized protein n=1 Tax=Daucus carota subsp. sativus TaxID=79200 RepID=A0A164YA10_DAUCS|nr:PREDICTED: uncharacterized protein LOC108219980 [Daucus carota subsp. sativus]WOH00515.1 hypothetical protein DCAR_0519880 [Daucus carota subsp. sativus]